MYSWEGERKRIGKNERQALFGAQRGKCMYCGIKAEMTYFDVDHKTPVARGGSNRFSNYQLLCSPCNRRKGALTDGEFRRKYKLTPSRKAKGPPSRKISQSRFEVTTKKVATRRAKRRKSEDDWWF